MYGTIQYHICRYFLPIICHTFQALGRKMILQDAGQGQIDLLLVPYDLLTEKEKRKNRERCQELLKYIQYQGYSLFKMVGTKHDEDRLSEIG